MEDPLDEKDELKKSLAIISEELEEAKSGLWAYDRAYDELYKQVHELAIERNGAIALANGVHARIGGLSNQLREINSHLPELEQWNMELQATVEELEVQIEEINSGSTEQLTKESNRESWEIAEPDVEYIPTPQDVVEKMLELAKVTKDDLVYDLGCGDGRIVVTAAKKYGCKAIGYEIDPQLVKEARQNVEDNNVGHLVRIEQKDIFTLDLSKATVITLYLLPDLNVKLIPQLKKLKYGSRIVSHSFGMGAYRPEKVVKMNSNEDDDKHRIYMWTSPLRLISRKRL